MHEEANLVDQACAAERPNEPGTAVREQVAVRLLLLELGDRGGEIPVDEGRLVPDRVMHSSTEVWTARHCTRVPPSTGENEKVSTTSLFGRPSYTKVCTRRCGRSIAR